MEDNYTILSIDIGKKNLGYSIYNGVELKFGIFNITKYIKQYKLHENMEGRNTILLNWLKQLYKKYGINKIVVEKQVINNVVAMCIQSCIISFGILNNIEILSYDPKNKFTFSGDTYNSSKKEHKKLAIKYTENILNSLIKDYINKDSDVVIPSRASVDIDNEIQRLNNYVPQKTECDIFISYRREGGRDCARTIKLKLHELGYKRIFFDYSSIRDGVFNTQILDAIYSCKDFLLLLSPNSMDRCINRDDWAEREIRTAFKYSRKIIPITMQDNFEWPESCPKDLKRIQELQYHKLLVDEYFDVSVARLSERLETSIENKLTLMTEQQFYYKIASSIKCKVYIDDKECFVIDKDGFKKVPLPKGEYFVRFVDYENNREILKKIVCIDSYKAEML